MEIIKNWIMNVKQKLGIIDFYEYWEYRKQLLIKKGLVCGENVHILCTHVEAKYASIISIGDNVTITNSTVLAHDGSTKKPFGYSKIGGVTIGNNSFIGYGSIILPGTIIEDNCIIGAGSVVRGHIPSDSLVIGNPAQIVGSASEFLEKNKKRLEEYGIVDIRSTDGLEKFRSCGNWGFEI